MTTLAQTALRAALRLITARSPRNGEPLDADGLAQELVILGMASSAASSSMCLPTSPDLRLPDDGETDGARAVRIANSSSVGRRVIGALNDMTPDGYVSSRHAAAAVAESGPLAVSYSALEQYPSRRGVRGNATRGSRRAR